MGLFLTALRDPQSTPHTPFHTMCQCTFGVGTHPQSTTIMVVHTHFSVNTTIDIYVKPNFVRCDLGMHVRWRTQCGHCVTVEVN